MYSRFILSVFLSFAFLANTVFGQEQSWQPKRIPSLYPSNVAAVKIYQNKNKETVLGVITFSIELQSYTVEVPYLEWVSFKEKDPKSGKWIVKQREVRKTKTESKTRNVVTQKRIEVSLSKAKFWTVSGKKLTVEDAIKRLVKPKRCYVTAQKNPYKYFGDQYFSEMLKEDVLVIGYDPSSAKEVKGKSNPSAIKSWMPKQIPSVLFSNVATIHVVADQERSHKLNITTFPQVPKQITQKFAVTVMVKELVTDPKTGKKTERSTPKTAYRTALKTQMEVVPRSRKVSLDALKIWNLHGKTLTTDEVKTALSTKKRCFLLPYNPGKRTPGDPFFAEMFKDDVLLVWFDSQKVRSTK